MKNRSCIPSSLISQWFVNLLGYAEEITCSAHESPMLCLRNISRKFLHKIRAPFKFWLVFHETPTVIYFNPLAYLDKWWFKFYRTWFFPFLFYSLPNCMFCFTSACIHCVIKKIESTWYNKTKVKHWWHIGKWTRYDFDYEKKDMTKMVFKVKVILLFKRLILKMTMGFYAQSYSTKYFLVWHKLWFGKMLS